jgi:RIO-like serine/threonine protein kinase
VCRVLKKQELQGMGSGWELVLAEGVQLDVPESHETLAYGRGGIRRLGDIVLRPYRRGGLVRHFNERIYTTSQRFAQEFLVHQALWGAGFPTVEPLGYAFRRKGWGFEGVFLTRYVDATPWPKAWSRTEVVLPRLCPMLESLCAWGLYAPDLNATNVLITPSGDVLALDWDRANWTSPEDLMARYRDRLTRSLRKLGAPQEAVDGI